jgi:tetrahydromethanopterin S-methyltransferase subunit F
MIAQVFAVCHSFQTITTGMMLGFVTGFLFAAFLVGVTRK